MSIANALLSLLPYFFIYMVTCAFFSQKGRGGLGVWEYFMFYCWLERFFERRFNKQFVMAVYPFFRMQNYRQNKISGSISVIYFTVRYKYCSFTLTKKRSLALEKKHLIYNFLKLKYF